jgi:hypothetical protein
MKVKRIGAAPGAAAGLSAVPEFPKRFIRPLTRGVNWVLPLPRFFF